MNKADKVLLKAALFAILITQLLLILPFKDASARENGKVVVVAMDMITLEELYLSDTPNIDSLLSKGAVGLMTTNTAGSRSPRDTYLTIGAGAKAVGSEKSKLGLSKDELYEGKPAYELFRQNTGKNINNDCVVNLGIAQCIRNNEKKPYSAYVGALGSVLRDGGLTTAVFGNSDTAVEYKRYLVSMFMDNEGIVPLGFVDKRYLAENKQRPFGIETDHDMLIEDIKAVWNKADVIAIDFGDTSRAEDFRYEATDEMNETYKRQAIESCDTFIGKLTGIMDFTKDLLIILTPSCSAKALTENNRLTPFIIAGKGIKKGFVTSRSTRIPGVITNLDIGCTIISFFGLETAAGQLGSPVFSAESSKGIDFLVDYNKRLIEIYNHRYFLLRSYVIAQIAMLAVSLILIMFRRKHLKYLKPFIIFLMTIPLVYLVLPLFHHSMLFINFLLSWTAAALITALLFFSKIKSTSKIMLISSFTVLLLIVDQLTGRKLIMGSPLGYDIISGARFYGIGNEYMGVLIGASCLTAGIITDVYSHKYKIYIKIMEFAMLSVVLFTLAYPALGANVGGTASMAAAFLSYALLKKEMKINFKFIIYLIGFVVLMLLGVFVLDSLRAFENQSHMGQAINSIRKNGAVFMYNIVFRKISMNLKLFRYTIWTRALLGSFVVIIVLLFRPIGVIKDIINKLPNTFIAFVAAIIGSIMAFLTNDSGIVAAATTMIFVAPPMILLVVDRMIGNERKKTHHKA